MRWIVGLLLALASGQLARAADVDALYRALERSDTAAVERFVTDHYRDAGISVNDTLVWERQAFDQIVNWYNENTEVIMLSELPKPAEVAPYWDNWSEVLTQGRWAWRDFFVDPAEAALMANFNQFFVAAHEYGHALTYRYDPQHEARFDHSVNCREFFADRLAASLLEELAADDDRIAALRQRYRALIETINALIDVNQRYAAPTLAALEADCRILDVAQPSQDSMTPYVSAFFVRHGLLLAADLPPLAEIYDRYLFPHLRERQYPPAGTGGAVTSGAPVVRVPATEPLDLSWANEQLAFAPDGTIFEIHAYVDPDSAPPRVAFRYGPVGAPPPVVLLPTALPGIVLGDFPILTITSVAALGPDHFVALSGGSGLGGSPVLVLEVQRIGGAWQLRIVDLEPDLARAQEISQVGIVRDSAGSLQAWLLDPAAADRPARWRRLPLDPATLAPGAASFVPAPDLTNPVAQHAAGDSIFSHGFQLLSVSPAGDVRRIAGNGLQGLKDSPDPLTAEFMLPGAPVYLRPDGGLDVIDYDRARATYILRHIAPAQ